MADCECATCTSCDGHGYVLWNIPTPEEGDVPRIECDVCDGTGVNPGYTGCDC